MNLVISLLVMFITVKAVVWLITRNDPDLIMRRERKLVYDAVYDQWFREGPEDPYEHCQYQRFLNEANAEIEELLA
jgi:hypothetical protein